MSNRVATLAGVSDILAGDPSVPPILRALSDEVPRLEEGLRLLRLLAVPEGEGEEALEPMRVLDDALALARLYPGATDESYRVSVPEWVPPVVAFPTLLTHAFVVMLVAAAEQRSEAGAIEVRVEVLDDAVVVSAGEERVECPTLATRRGAIR